MTVTRRQIVVTALGALAAGAAPAHASEPGGLDGLLALERRLEAAYNAALDQGAIDAALGRSLLAQEREHVRGVGLALETLGSGRSDSEAAPPPARALEGRRSFAGFALALETETVAAYAGVLATLDAPKLRQPLGSIMASGAQHTVALRRLLGEPLLGP